jgi:hypothetical protein
VLGIPRRDRADGDARRRLRRGRGETQNIPLQPDGLVLQVAERQPDLGCLPGRKPQSDRDLERAVPEAFVEVGRDVEPFGVDRRQGDEFDVLEDAADAVLGVGTPPGNVVGHVRNPDDKPGALARLEELRHVAIPARETAVVVADIAAVHPDPGVAVNAVEAEEKRRPRIPPARDLPPIDTFDVRPEVEALRRPLAGDLDVLQSDGAPSVFQKSGGGSAENSQVPLRLRTGFWTPASRPAAARPPDAEPRARGRGTGQTRPASARAARRGCAPGRGSRRLSGSEEPFVADSRAAGDLFQSPPFRTSRAKDETAARRGYSPGAGH